MRYVSVMLKIRMAMGPGAARTDGILSLANSLDLHDASLDFKFKIFKFEMLLMIPDVFARRLKRLHRRIDLRGECCARCREGCTERAQQAAPLRPRDNLRRERPPGCASFTLTARHFLGLGAPRLNRSRTCGRVRNLLA